MSQETLDKLLREVQAIRSILRNIEIALGDIQTRVASLETSRIRIDPAVDRI